MENPTCEWKEHGKVSIPSKIQLNQTVGSKVISPPSWSIPGHRSDGLIFLVISSTGESTGLCHVAWKPTIRCSPGHLHRLVTK